MPSAEGSIKMRGKSLCCVALMCCAVFFLADKLDAELSSTTRE